MIQWPDWLELIPDEDAPATPVEGLDSLSDDELLNRLRAVACVARTRSRQRQADTDWQVYVASCLEHIRQELHPAVLELFADVMGFLGTLPRLEPSAREAWGELLSQAPTAGADGPSWRVWLLAVLEMQRQRSVISPPAEPEPPPPEPPPRRAGLNRDWLRSALKEAFAELSEHPHTDVRVGLDFGTSRSKLVARDLDGTVVEDAWAPGAFTNSAVGITREDHLLYGDEAVQAFQERPNDIFLLKSLKRVLLDGTAPGVAQRNSLLTTSHLVLAALTGLQTEASTRIGLSPGDFVLRACHPVLDGQPRLHPFWRVGIDTERVTYDSYLAWATFWSALWSRALNGRVQDLQQLLHLVDMSRDLVSKMQPVLARRRISTTSEPLAALNEHTDAELGNGLHLLVDVGAGTTDWVVQAVHGTHRCLVREGTFCFGGDDLDEAMVEMVADECGGDLDDIERMRIGLAVERDKPLLVADEMMEVDPNLVLGCTGLLRVDIGLDQLEKSMRPKLARLQQQITRSLLDVDTDATTWLQSRGVGSEGVLGVRAVRLLGGGALVPFVASTIRNAVIGASLGWNGRTEPLPIPQTEISAGRVDEEQYRVSAVALGASRAEVRPHQSWEGNHIEQWRDPGPADRDTV